jgi:SNF2 family DNA or RNA helicase
VSKTFTPREYQRIAADFLSSTPRAALWAGMGMGKTSATLHLLDTLHNILGEDRPTLVVAPKRVALSTWPDEQRKWSSLSGLSLAPVIGTPAERKLALLKDVAVKTINYDNLPWLVEHYGSKWPFGTIVADESTRLKGFRMRQGGARAQALAQMAHARCDRFWQLTGTPAPNGLLDLWGQMWFLDQGQALGRTYESFKTRWFQPVKTGDGYYKWIPHAHSQDEIMQRVSHLALTIDPADWFDLEKPIVNVIEVDLEPSARAKYDEFEKEMFLALDEGDIEAFGGAGKTMKCLQLANGAAYLDPERYGKDRYVEVSYAKLDALESVVEEANGAPVLVAYHFKSDLARLLRAFPKGRHLDADPATVEEWNAGRIPLLFAHPASAGHGLNLQDGGNIIVFFGHWWDLEQHDQIVERIGPVRQLQSGHKRPVFIHYIVARDTVDELVMLRRESKRAVQDLLLDYMKRRR